MHRRRRRRSARPTPRTSVPCGHHAHDRPCPSAGRRPPCGPAAGPPAGSAAAVRWRRTPSPVADAGGVGRRGRAWRRPASASSRRAARCGRRPGSRVAASSRTAGSGTVIASSVPRSVSSEAVTGASASDLDAQGAVGQRLVEHLGQRQRGRRAPAGSLIGSSPAGAKLVSPVMILHLGAHDVLARVGHLERARARRRSGSPISWLSSAGASCRGSHSRAGLVGGQVGPAVEDVDREPAAGDLHLRAEQEPARARSCRGRG